MKDHQLRGWPSSESALRLSKVFVLSLLLLPLLLATRPMHAQTFKVLHDFSGTPDGCQPEGDLFRDAAGDLFGTAATCGSAGDGIVFKLSATGTETILYTFTGKADGGSPRAGLIRDSTGAFYGTAYSGGASGDGVVFKLLGKKETVIHSFSGPDGSHPTASLIRDAAGNLYGTTFYGGTQSCSCGTVFKIDPTGNETVLYSFSGGADGKFPAGRLLLGANGTLFGTASEGGRVNCGKFSQFGCGVVFKVTQSGTQSVLYSFNGGSDGGQPMAGLIRDSSGNFYGTTFTAGDVGRECALYNGCGVIFELSKGHESVLYTFTNSTDGANPVADLVRDSAGTLWGTAKNGGAGYGVVFSFNSSGENPLHIFTGNSDGAGPVAGLVLDSLGNVYGTSAFGGYSAEGVIFELVP